LIEVLSQAVATNKKQNIPADAAQAATLTFPLSLGPIGF
jgi:hypothetical protein